MKPFFISAFLLAALSLALIACSKASFQSVSLTVLDKETAKPVAGATVTIVCMGLSPYATNSYATDAQGLAHVMKYAGGISALTVTAAGYEVANTTVLSNETVLRLTKRL